MLPNNNYNFHHLHPGDIVRIPEALNMEKSCIARVERLYPRFVLFRKVNGMALTALHTEAASIPIIHPSDYKLYDEIQDLLNAFSIAKPIDED